MGELPGALPAPGSAGPPGRIGPTGSIKAVAIAAGRYGCGSALGALTAVGGLLLLLVAGAATVLSRPWTRGPASVPDLGKAAIHTAVEFELRRLDRWFGTPVPGPHQYERKRATRYLLARIPLGLLGGLVLSCAAVGLSWMAFALFGWLFTDIAYPLAVTATGFLGLFGVFVCAQGVYGTALLEEQLVRRILGPNRQDELERRIAQLSHSRAEVMAAVDDERRRIERDLHDGVQQRLVALGMLLGRARRSRDPGHADELLLQAHEASRLALTELREVAWRVYPTVLDEAGLRAALETVAERTSLPVRLEYEVDRELIRPVETVAYFVVSEAVTNVVKHSGATRIAVSLHTTGTTLRLRIEDDGSGGADPTGSGLTGLTSRVAALDGRLRVHSPVGGPTTITAELPCA